MAAAPEAHLLIVDDDERIRGLLQKYLVRNGFLVSAARDAAHARRLLAGLEFDLIVLDVMMPGEDGVSLTRGSARHHDDADPAADGQGRETEDRIAGLEAGADDYLVKPFEPKELLLRINAILRRMPEAKGPDRGRRSCTSARCAMTWIGASCGVARTSCG
jgi:two-component system, OmpR family, phosphate regulon response regulator OmpR